MSTLNPETIRECVRAVKMRLSGYHLPADSFIEAAVRDCSTIISNEGDNWKETLKLVPNECVVHFREGGGLEDFEASVAISVSKLSSKYEEMKEAATYVFNKLELKGFSKLDCFEFFAGKANLPGLKMALRLIEDDQKAMKSMGPMMTIDPSADAAFDRCKTYIAAAIARNGKPSTSELMGV